MYDLIFFFLMCGAGALALAAAYTIFEIAIYIMYKRNGGRLGLISYFKNL